LKPEIVVLDAMGVMYSVGDDVRDLLCPFIAEKGGLRDTDRIRDVYISASLGNISASRFWESVGVSSDLEDEYLRRHKLNNGLIEFLEAANSRGSKVWCLSNDVSAWSEKLRTRFGLEEYFRGFVISGDVGFRKPDPAIYRNLLEQIGGNVSSKLFVDDNPKNLDAAARLGFETILFDAGVSSGGSAHERASSFGELQRYLLEA
jgi:HAD superfamily hydrolase (TIGR01509 family)